MRILIFGAGSIGQLYGHILARGGASVDVFIKPDYVEDARRGYRIYDRKKGLQSPQVFVPDHICTTAEQVAQRDYDAVILCISSTGLRSGWLPDFSGAIDDTTLISLTPGLRDREYLADYFSEDQLATGLITAVSYPAPLPGETAEESGTAYWLPPLTPAFFKGPSARLSPVLESLEAGGMKTHQARDLETRAATGSALLMPLVATLESVDWSFAELKRSRSTRKRLDQAVDEALTVVEDHLAIRRPLPTRILGPMSWRGLLTIAPVVPPFDLETYLEVHFTKVGDQTRLFIDDYIEHRTAQGQTSPALTALREAIGDAPCATATDEH